MPLYVLSGRRPCQARQSHLQTSPSHSALLLISRCGFLRAIRNCTLLAEEICYLRAYPSKRPFEESEMRQRAQHSLLLVHRSHPLESGPSYGWPAPTVRSSPQTATLSSQNKPPQCVSHLIPISRCFFKAV